MNLKILFAGIHAAGKTSIIRTLDQESLESIEAVRPTIGMEITEMKFLGFNILRWDIGGQVSYRQQFLQNFKVNIQGTHLILFVISVQEKQHEKEALIFLKDICNKLEMCPEKPHIGVLLHKLDPNSEHLIKIAKYADKVERKCRAIIDSYGYTYFIFRSSIYDPESCLEAFALMLNSRFPKGEYVSEKIKDICKESGTEMGMAHAVGGDKQFPFLFGRYIRKGSDVNQAVEFLKTTYSLAERKHLIPESGEIRRNFREDEHKQEIFARAFKVGNITTVFSTVIPEGKIEHDEGFKENLNNNIEDLQKLLNTIAIGMGLKTAG